MEIKLDPNSGFLTKDKKKFDKRLALYATGVKAAVCFKDGDITPEDIRATETEERIIKRGINTILSDHTSPSEQPTVSLEITGIPKILCMILNNEHLYAADERSLRYTEVKESAYISGQEVKLYNKWLAIFTSLLKANYLDFFLKYNKGATEEQTTKKASNAIKKIAQENARYMVSVFMPTTLTYTVPLAQINKLCLYMKRIIDNPHNEFEQLLIPYLKEFIENLKGLDVLVTEHDVTELCPDLAQEDSDTLLYQNNKSIDLSLFAERNKFSGINLPNEYGTTFSYNMEISLASLAQFHRHRTINYEMLVPDKDDMKFYIPLLLEDEPVLSKEWLEDILKVRSIYPQGTIVRVNANGPLKHLVNYVGKERACDRAFLETEDMFTNIMLPDIYAGLISSGKTQLADTLKPYVGRLRCMYPDYNCPTPCGHARIRRKF